MPGPEMDLKRELFEAGNRLLKPPGSADDLLALLDRVEHCLSFVEQQPPVEMQDALCPAFKALVTKELLKHADIDVRVGVTACLTEISRITAPDVPYGDQLMKEFFRLTISAFEGLSDKSSKSFGKRVSILETVARVRSCAVLLDLDCDGLVVEMFQNFYKCIRDFHSTNVFSSMESIMTLVIEEYDEISTDLLFALLSVLKRENQDALPIAKRLGEKVVQNCANKLKSCIVEAIKSLKINLLDYDFVVTLACQIAPNHNPFGEITLKVPLVNGCESAMKTVEKEAVNEATHSLSVEIPSIGNIVPVDDAAEDMYNTSRELDSNAVGCATGTIPSKVQVGRGAVTNDMAMNPKSVSKPKSEKIAKKRGHKHMKGKYIMQTDSSKLPQPDASKQSSESQVPETNISMEVLEAHHHDSSMDPNVPEKNCDSSNQLSPKAVENNMVNLGSPPQTDIPPEKSSSEMIRRSEKPISVQEATSSHQNSEKKLSDELKDSETIHVASVKDAPDRVGDASNFISSVEVKNEQDIEGDSEDNPPKHSDIKLGVADGTPRSKKRGRPRKDANMTAASGVKDWVVSEGTSQRRSRLRFTFPEEGKEYGEDLVGSRIKVWWPLDKEYYDGIVESYDPIKRRHKILYTDNETEILKLRRHRWKLVKSCIGSEKDPVTSHTNAGHASDKMFPSVQYSWNEKQIQEGNKSKADSSSAGIMGNTDSSLKRRRGRPPKNYAALASYDSAVKGSKSEGQTKSSEIQIDSVADDGNPIKLMDSVAKCEDALNSNPENSKHDGGTQMKQDVIMGTGATDSVAPKPAKRFDINDPFTYRSDDESDISETVTPKMGNSNASMTKEVKSDSVTEQKNVGLNLKFPAFGAEINSRKRKPRTIFNSSSPAGSMDTSTKKRRGRPPYKFLHQNSIEESKDHSKQLGDPKVDDSRSVNPSDTDVVVKSKDSLFEGRNAPYLTVERNITKTTLDSTRIGTKEEVALALNSSKSNTGEMKLGSPTGLKIKFKTSVSEPKIRRRRSRKTTSSPSEQLNKDGSIKRPRGRPPFRLKLESPNPYSKPEDNVNPRAVSQHRADGSDSASIIKPESEIIHKDEISLGKGSGPISKNDTSTVSNVLKDPVPAHVGMKDKKDPAHVGIKDKKDAPEIADNIYSLSSNIGNNSVAEEARDLKVNS